MNGAGFGVDRPAVLTRNDDEYDAFRKRMMLAYRFRPNPLVTSYAFLFVLIAFSEYVLHLIMPVKKNIHIEFKYML